MDPWRPRYLGAPVIADWKSRCEKQRWNHLWAYKYMVQLYPCTMWQK